MTLAIPLVGPEVFSGLADMTGELRLIVAAAAIVLLVYWAVERTWGEDDDPVLKASASSDTGSFSILSSGMAAVGVVATVAAISLAPELASGQVAIVAILVGLVGVHYFYEKEERE